MKKNKIYYVYWHDTLGIDEWSNWETIENQAKLCAMNQETVGVYIGSSSGYEIFASTLNKSNNMLPYANISLIPKGCIVKIKEIKCK